MWKFEEDCLKTKEGDLKIEVNSLEKVWGDRFFNEIIFIRRFSLLLPKITYIILPLWSLSSQNLFKICKSWKKQQLNILVKYPVKQGQLNKILFLPP